MTARDIAVRFEKKESGEENVSFVSSTTNAAAASTPPSVARPSFLPVAEPFVTESSVDESPVAAPPSSPVVRRPSPTSDSSDGADFDNEPYIEWLQHRQYYDCGVVTSTTAVRRTPPSPTPPSSPARRLEDHKRALFSSQMTQRSRSRQAHFGFDTSFHNLEAFLREIVSANKNFIIFLIVLFLGVAIFLYFSGN
ncbi:hypothetical protein HELRODRAFT_192783 [Helobdella robusta]|uniref:Uncharacterized protein n=1 Tax=Helobdella robusta TaxID=6412 RepID=T1FUA3_HELRO|nr:hypothetical protein HELRODRAFT_192783 [Helobdella robusta]ESN99771.1 hypothetical protein HELRODRAFT_192783 [Helobdella robusta]